jgi:CRP/FNR family transcriptional regulator
MASQWIDPAPSDTATIHNFGVSCGQCTRKGFCFPASLRGAEIDRLDDIVGNKPILQRNEFLFREGEEFRALYALRTGTLKAYKRTLDNEEQVTGFFYPGQIIGLDGIFSGAHASSAIALETSAICEIPYAELQALSAGIPRLQRYIYTLLSRRIVADKQLITLIGKCSAEERIAALLLQLINGNLLAELSPRHLQLPMRRVDMANHVGLTVETVSRVLSRMEKQKILRVHKRDITVLNTAALVEFTTSDGSPKAARQNPGEAGLRTQSSMY